MQARLCNPDLLQPLITGQILHTTQDPTRSHQLPVVIHRQFLVKQTQPSRFRTSWLLWLDSGNNLT